jgi:hypothetical protein
VALMVDNTLALRGANPPINALGNFQQGMEAAASTEANRFKMAAATMEIIGSGAMYAMNGDINGEVDPKKYAEVIESFEKMGLDVSQFRDNPGFAKVAAQASISALDRIKIAQNEREFDLAEKKFETDLMAGLQPKAPEIGTIFDEEGRERKVIWDPATKAFVPIGGAKGDTAKAPDVQTFFDENGAEQKMQWDGEKRAWVPVGGAKATDKAPTMQTVYDDNGKERKVQWDPAKKAWVPVGGTKADSPKAPSIQTIYSENGQEQKVQWDEKKGAYVPIGGEKAPSGTKFSLTQPDGTTIEFGEGNLPLGKAAQNEVDKKALNTSELGARLGSVAKDFKPEYQTLGTRFANWFRSGKASLGAELDPAEEQELSNFAKYRAGAIDNLNTILKEMSGAAVTPQEFERIKAVMPNAGTGVFDGDDPVTFQAKLERALTETDKALARYQYYTAHGIAGSVDKIPLNDVQQIDGVWYVMDRSKKGSPVYKIGEKPAEAK